MLIEQRLKKNLIRQTLLADISQNFMSSENLDEKLNLTLNLLGKHTNVSRVYIFQDHENEKMTSNTYEWCNIGISSQINSLQNIFYEKIPSWRKIFDEKGKIFSSNIRELPDDILQVLEPQDIKSILVFPLYVQNTYFGFIGFDECEKDKDWELEDVELLRTITGIISNSFERKLLEKKLIDSEKRYFALSDTTSDAILISENGICIDINQSAVNMFGYTSNELIGIHGTEIIAEESKETLLQNMLDMVDEPFPAFALRKDGSKFKVEIRGKMFQYQGKVVRVFIFRDISKL